MKAKHPNPSQPARPKYERVRETLRQEILNGSLAPGARLPSDNQLYKRFKIHRLTALRALSDLAREGLIVRRRGSGTFVAEKNHPPAALPGRKLKLGILWRGSVLPSSILNTYLATITRGAVEALGLDFLRITWPLGSQDQATRARWEAHSLGIHVECLGEPILSETRHPPIEDVRASGFTGILGIGLLENAFLDELLALGLPVVLADVLNQRLDGKADQVFADPFSGYRQAVRHFHTQGLRRIHFVGAQITLPAPSTKMSKQQVRAYRGNRTRPEPDSVLRCSAFRQGMAECGLEVPAQAIHAVGPEPKAMSILAQRLAALPASQRPEGVICHEVEQAEALIAHFDQRGLTLQGAGAATNSSNKALPIRLDLKLMGASAAELLLSGIMRPARPRFRLGIPMTFEVSLGSASKKGVQPPCAKSS